ncbi:hypothetical protein C8R43DRAFT_1186504 [Mycena crocata]|nr:hypothetical protein C8R43DRAFT_1186504 [Mycena crocata]
MSQPLFFLTYKPLFSAFPSSISTHKKSPPSQEHTHISMAPTSTLNFAGRDLDSNDVASVFDQPTATPSPWIDPNIPEGFSLPILLGLIGLCVLGAIMVFILWRWNSVFFSDLPADHKDLITQWKTRHLKATDAASSATTLTETLVESKLAPPAPAYTAAADNAAPGAEDALFHLTRANTLENQRRTVQVFTPQLITSVPPVPRPSQGVTGVCTRKKAQRCRQPTDDSLIERIPCFPSSIHFPPRLHAICHLPFEFGIRAHRLQFRIQVRNASLILSHFDSSRHSPKSSSLKRRRAEQWEISDPALV